MEGSKSLQEELLGMLDIPMKDGEITDQFSSLTDLKGRNVTVQQAIAFAQIRKALDGDTRAFSAIMDVTSKVPASKGGGRVTAFDSIAKQYQQGSARKSAT